jgi:hypothetical protein
MSLCTYCHAPLAPGTQAGFDLSPLFMGCADLPAAAVVLMQPLDATDSQRCVERIVQSARLH